MSEIIDKDNPSYVDKILRKALQDVDVIDAKLNEFERTREKKILQEVTSSMKLVMQQLKDIGSNPKGKTKENAPLHSQLNSRMKELVQRTKSLAVSSTGSGSMIMSQPSNNTPKAAQTQSAPSSAIIPPASPAISDTEHFATSTPSTPIMTQKNSNNQTQKSDLIGLARTNSSKTIEDSTKTDGSFLNNPNNTVATPKQDKTTDSSFIRTSSNNNLSRTNHDIKDDNKTPSSTNGSFLGLQRTTSNNNIQQQQQPGLNGSFKNLRPLRGWLKKQGEDMFKGWKKRYFVQLDNQLMYYANEPTATTTTTQQSQPMSPNSNNNNTSLGYIDLTQVNQVVVVNKDQFDIVTNNRTYHLQLFNKDDSLKYWVDGLTLWVNYLKNRGSLERQLREEEELKQKQQKEEEEREKAAETERRLKEEKEAENAKKIQEEEEENRIRKQKEEAEEQERQRKLIEEEEKARNEKQLEEQRRIERELAEKQEKEREEQERQQRQQAAEEEELRRKQQEEEEKRKKELLLLEQEREREEMMLLKKQQEEEEERERERLLLLEQEEEQKRKREQELEEELKKQQELLKEQEEKKLLEQQLWQELHDTEHNHHDNNNNENNDNNNSIHNNITADNNNNQLVDKEEEEETVHKPSIAEEHSNEHSENIHHAEEHQKEHHNELRHVDNHHNTKQRANSRPLSIEISSITDKDEQIRILTEKVHQLTQQLGVHDTNQQLMLRMEEELKQKEKQYEYLRGKHKSDLEAKKMAEERLDALKVNMKQLEEESHAKDKTIRQLQKKLKQSRSEWLHHDSTSTSTNNNNNNDNNSNLNPYSNPSPPKASNNNASSSNTAASASGPNSMRGWEFQNPEVELKNREIQQLKDAIWAHQSQNAMLATEFDRLQRENASNMKVKEETIKRLEKELAHVKENHQAMREKFVNQQVTLLDPEDRSLASELQKLKKAYFFSAVVSIRLTNSPDCNINANSLYEQAIAETVEWPSWPEWIANKIAEQK